MLKSTSKIVRVMQAYRCKTDLEVLPLCQDTRANPVCPVRSHPAAIFAVEVVTVGVPPDF